MKYSPKEYRKFADLLIDKVNNKMVQKLGAFNYGIRFDNVEHFADRLYDRGIEPIEVRNLMYSLINNHLCELIYAISLPDEYVRIDFEHDGLFIGATVNKTRTIVVLRTAVDATARHPGKQKEYVLTVK